VSEATHDAGGTLDVVCVRGDLPLPAVDVVDVGLSDHRLLRWTSQLYRPPSLYTTAVGRRWTLFDVDVFRADLLTSSLCDVGSYVDLDGHALATLYESTVSQLLDRQIPARSVTCRRRTSSLWFDDECRQPAFCGTVWQMVCELLTATARPTKTLLLHVVISDS